MTDNTRINLKHYIGKPFRNEAVALVTGIGLALGGGIGSGFAIHSALDENVDTDGTVLQETAYQEALGSIQSLELQQNQLEIAKKQHEIDILTGELSGDDLSQNKRNLRLMSEDVAFESLRTLVGLFNAGEPGQEADISEQQFFELAQKFEESVGSTESFGLEIDVDNAAYFDEARIAMAEAGDVTGNPAIDAQTLSDKMSSMSENPSAFGVLGGFGAMVLLILASIGGLGKLEDWSYESRRVERRRPKKNAMNH